MFVKSEGHFYACPSVILHVCKKYASDCPVCFEPLVLSAGTTTSLCCYGIWNLLMKNFKYIVLGLLQKGYMPV